MYVRHVFAGLAAYNMVFTQGRGFVIGASFGLPCWLALVTCFDLPRRGHRLFGNLGSFLVNYLVLRSLLASVRSGVVKPSVVRA